ncbi:hypothetical protein J6590_094867 [Homalodisca vitripennis]|nr:hypothetical protein J6590_094867 [Homalodisca vitripennis]
MFSMEGPGQTDDVTECNGITIVARSEYSLQLVTIVSKMDPYVYTVPNFDGAGKLHC